MWQTKMPWSCWGLPVASQVYFGAFEKDTAFDLSDHGRPVKCPGKVAICYLRGNLAKELQPMQLWSENLSKNILDALRSDFLPPAIYHNWCDWGGTGGMSALLCSFVLKENLIWKALNLSQKITLHQKSWNKSGLYTYNKWRSLLNPLLINCHVCTWSCFTV